MPAATSFLSSPAGASHLPFSLVLISSSSSSSALKPHVGFIFNSLPKCPPRLLFSSPHAATAGRTSLLLRPSALAVDDALGQSADTFSVQPKIDKSGRFCSPRAARELALMTLYASCLEGTDPVRLFEKRLSIRRDVLSDWVARGPVGLGIQPFGKREIRIALLTLGVMAPGCTEMRIVVLTSRVTPLHWVQEDEDCCVNKDALVVNLHG